MATPVALGVNGGPGDHLLRQIPVDGWLQLLRKAGDQPPILPLALPEAWLPIPRSVVTGREPNRAGTVLS